MAKKQSSLVGAKAKKTPEEPVLHPKTIKRKNLKKIDEVLEFCKENGITYADFQIRETWMHIGMIGRL